MKTVKHLMPIILTLALLLSFSACGKKTGGDTDTNKPDLSSPETQTGDPTKDDDAPQYGGTFISTQAVNPSSLFYIHMTGSSSSFVSMCNEPLGRYSDETTHYEPFLAKTFTSSVENKTFTITLREGILFHDGSVLNAEALKWNLEYMVQNGQGSTIGNPIGFECPDDYTVVIQYEKFSVDWADKLGPVLISSKEAFDTNGLEYMQNHPVGTGPFVFSEYVPDNYLNYVRNDNYWQEGLPYLDGYRVQIIAEWSALMSAFVNDEVNSFVCGDEATSLALIGMGFENKQIETFTGNTLFCIYPNSKVQGDPWYDLSVRQAALLYGVNWDSVNILGGGGTYSRASLQGCIDGSMCYSPELEDESYYDLDKAKQMLSDAGYPDGFSTTIYATPVNLKAATAVQDELKNLNISAEVSEITFSDTCRWDGVTPGLFMCNGYSANDFIANPISMWYCSTSASYGKNMNFSPKYDELLEKALASTTYEERAEYGKELIRLLHVDECLQRTMYMTSNTTFISDHAHASGYETNRITPELTWMEQ